MPASPSGCPGQDARFLTAGIHKCPSCGAQVEMFSDEQRRRCHRCGEMVTKEQAPSCVQWCQHARSCLGEARYAALTAIDDSEKPPS